MLRAFFARSPDGSTVLFRYYLLGGNTAAPSGLLTRLCHVFLVYLTLAPRHRFWKSTNLYMNVILYQMRLISLDWIGYSGE